MSGSLKVKMQLMKLLNVCSHSYKIDLWKFIYLFTGGGRGEWEGGGGEWNFILPRILPLYADMHDYKMNQKICFEPVLSWKTN